MGEDGELPHAHMSARAGPGGEQPHVHTPGGFAARLAQGVDPPHPHNRSFGERHEHHPHGHHNGSSAAAARHSIQPEDPELSPPPPPVWMEIAEVGGAPGTHALQHARRHPQRPDGEWALAAAEQPVLAEPPTPLARMIAHTLGDLGRWPGAAGPDPMLPGAVLVLAVATLALVCVCGGGRTLRRQLMWCAQSLRWGIGRLLRSGKSGAGYAGLGKFRDTSELGITLPRFDGAKIDAAREEVGTPSPTGPGRTVEFEMPWSSSGVLGYEDEARALVGAEKFAEKFAEDDPGRWSIESEEIHDGAADDADDDAGGATARLKRWQQRLARRRSAGGGEFGRGSGAAWSEHEMLMGMPRQVQGELWVAAWVAPLGIDAAQYAKMAEAAAKVRARLDADADGSFRRANAPLAADFDVIREDVPRTALPGDGGPVDAGALAQLLEAHALAESLARGSFGYVQGMADIGAFLLQRCAPWQAFGCLRSLVSRRFVQLLLRLDRDEWRQLSTAFTNLLHLHLPGLASHLEHVQLEPELYLPEWLMTLWTRALRPEARISSPLPSLPALSRPPRPTWQHAQPASTFVQVVCHVWNLVVIEGDRALLRAALAVCGAIEPCLLPLRDAGACRRELSAAPIRISLSEFCAQLDRCAVSDAVIDSVLSVRFTCSVPVLVD